MRATGSAEARIELRAAEQKLHALGFPQAEIDVACGNSTT